MLKTKNITEKNPYPKSVPNPSVHLEYNSFKINNLNEAEKKALKQIVLKPIHKQQLQQMKINKQIMII